MLKEQKKFKILKLIIFSVLTTILFFASLEIVQRVRYFLRFRSTYWLLYGFVNKPRDYAIMQEKGILRKLSGTEIVEVRTLYYDGYRKYNPKSSTDGCRINSYGFRGEEFDVNKKEGVERIITLGGSTTFGLGVTDAFTYPDFLEKLLNSDSNGRYEVINAGISSSAINEVSNLFDKEIIPLDPDVIVLNSFFNDFYYSKNTFEYRADFLQKINRILLNKSLFYMTFREKIAYISDRPVGDIYKASLDDMINNFARDDLFWHSLEASFTDIIVTARAHNIRIIIVKQPIWLRDSERIKCCMLFDKKFLPVYQRVRRLLDKIAADQNVEIIDAAYFFDSLPNKEKFFIDGLHLTPEGNKYLASLVAQEIIKDGYIQ